MTDSLADALFDAAQSDGRGDVYVRMARAARECLAGESPEALFNVGRTVGKEEADKEWFEYLSTHGYPTVAARFLDIVRPLRHPVEQ
jgi:hypothetical protein